MISTRFLSRFLLLVLSLFAACVLRADVPPSLPKLPFHLTARPFVPWAIEHHAYLDAVEGVCRYLATLQDDDGAIIDPYVKREFQYATPYFAFSVGVLLEVGRCADLRDAGIRAMEHATTCLAGGARKIPDRHGEFFVAPLTEALELYRGQTADTTWRAWENRLRTPMNLILENYEGRINNWRTYAMKGEWLRAKSGLIARESAVSFIEDAWFKRTQRDRIVADKWSFYQDWSSDPQSHAVEAVGRGNLLALIASGYDGRGHQEIRRSVRRGTEASLLWQDPSGQCPPNGRTDNHVFNDVLYQLAFEVMAEDAVERGDLYQAGQFRRAALVSFQSIARWRRVGDDIDGSYFVTKNHFDPADRIGYQPASQYTNYNGAVAYHLAEAYRVRKTNVPEQPAPIEVGGYVVAADPGFSSLVANAGGMQITANLRGDTVPKYGQFWSPLGIVRIGRVGWDSRLGPSDGVHDAKSSQAATFGPTWRSATGWNRLAEKATDYRGTVTIDFVHPRLVRLSILYHSVTGAGGPTFRHELTITPDGLLACLSCNEDIPFGLTIPLMVDDGRPSVSRTESPILSVATDEAGKAYEQNFLLLGEVDIVAAEDPIRSAVGWLLPVRVTSKERNIAVFVYPRTADDPSARAVYDSFRLTDTGHASCLGEVRDNIYHGRTAAGGRGQGLTLGPAKLQLEHVCDFIVECTPDRLVALEVDRTNIAFLDRKEIDLEPFVPVRLPAKTKR